MIINEVSKQIGSFIEKYSNNPASVEWPAWEYTILGAYEIKVDDSSLHEISHNLWTFEAIATLNKTDHNKTVTTIKKHTIIGNAKVSLTENMMTKDSLPEIKKVIITTIK